MPIGTGLALGLGIAGAGIGAAGSIAAGSIQAGAAKDAAGLQYQASQNALDFQKQVFNTQQAELQPWLRAGTGGINMLANLLGVNMGASGTPAAGATTPANTGGFDPGTIDMGNDGTGVFRALGTGRAQALLGDGSGLIRSNLINRGIVNSNTGLQNPTPAGPPGAPATGPGSAGFGSLLAPFSEQFNAPTDVTEQNDPGYQFRLKQGMQALENSAAARGGLLSTGTAKDINDYAQNYASNEYSNVYNRALTEYQQRYNIFQNNQANTFNRLAALSGIGQTAAGQLSSAGSNAAGNVSNILLGSAGQIGNSLQNAGAARASGYAGLTNAITGGIGNITQYALLQQLLGGGGATGNAGSQIGI